MLYGIARRAVALAMAGACLLAPALADDAAARCDDLAASPYDATRPAGVAGVEYAEIDVAAAEPECRAAWEADRVPRMGYQLARVLYSDGRIEDALALYSEAAAAGHIEAKVGMAQTSLDLARSASAALLQQAADAGSVNALYNMGVMTIDGAGLPYDVEKAIALYQQAADKGDAWSMYNLGVLYDEGEHVLRDVAKAKGYYEQAVAQDHAWAKINLGYVLLEGEVDAAERQQALDLFRSSAVADGDINAGLQLGIMLQDGTAAEQVDSETLVLAALKGRDAELGRFLLQAESGLSARNLAAVRAELGLPADGAGMDAAAIAALRSYYEAPAGN